MIFPVRDAGSAALGGRGWLCNPGHFTARLGDLGRIARVGGGRVEELACSFRFSDPYLGPRASLAAGAGGQACALRGVRMVDARTFEIRAGGGQSRLDDDCPWALQAVLEGGLGPGRFQVANAGVVSYTSSQEPRPLGTQVLQLAPEALVVGGP